MYYGKGRLDVGAVSRLRLDAIHAPCDGGNVMHTSVYRSAAPCLLLTVTSSCTLLGLGVGAALGTREGPFESHTPAERHALTRGDRVRVHLRRGTRLDGTYAGTRRPATHAPEGYLLLETRATPDGGDTDSVSSEPGSPTAGDTVQAVSVSEIRSIDIEVSGREWLYGGVIGLALDLTVATLVFVNIAQQNH